MARDSKNKVIKMFHVFAFAGEMTVAWVWKENALTSRTSYLHLMKVIM